MAAALRPPLVLGIETATALGGVALIDPDGLLGETTLRGARSHSERILPAVERLLADLGAERADLAAVAVSSGPGSFTGLRTGIAAAKGLAFALDKPLFGIPTLEVLATGVPPCGHPVCAVINARRGEWFRAVYLHGTAAPPPPEHVVADDELLSGLPGGCIVVGDLDPPTRTAARAAGCVPAPPHLCHPRAAAVAQGGLERLLAGVTGELSTLVPRYLRPPDAQAWGGERKTRNCMQ